MTRDNLLFAIIGVLLGFIIGFLFASNILQREAQQVSAPRAQGMPADHPAVGDPGAAGAPRAGAGGMQADVQAALTKARNEPNNFEAQLKAAELYYQIQRYDDSISYLLKANQLRPDDPETVGNLGMVNMDAGHFEAAETWYKAAITKKPDEVRIVAGYCNVLLELGKAKEAEPVLAKLEKLDPNSPDVARFNERLKSLKAGGKTK
jgi:tetratricopeptide (TPR) repeat protein